MPNEIGMAVNMLKQLLADDNAKETLSGLIGGLLDNNEDAANEAEENIVANVEEAEDEQNGIIEAEISENKPNSPLTGLLANLDVQSLYSNMIGRDDKRISLLNALRPYLNHRRCSKIDSAITIIQLVSISSTIGIDKMFGR